MRITLRPLLAEAIGTFFLVFCGVGAIITDTYRNGSVGLLGIAVAHGLALGIGISATMGVSGGHLNPAVTLSLASIGRIELPRALTYIAAQLAGAIIAILALKGLYPEQAGNIANYGAPRLANDVSMVQGIVIEAILTFMLMFAVMGTAVDPRGPKVGGFAIGLIVTVDILAGGMMTGAMMNPARATAPMLINMDFTGVGLYWVGPVLGAVVAAQLYERILMKAES